MLFANLMVAVMAVGLSVAALLKGHDALLTGLRAGGASLLQTAPLLLAAFAIAGLVPVVVPRELIARWVGGESGFRGVVMGTVAGALTPLGPFVAYPLGAAFLKAGAGIGTIVAYSASWGLLALTRIPIEYAFLGPKITAARVLLTLPFPLIAGYVAHLLLGRPAA